MPGDTGKDRNTLTQKSKLTTGTEPAVSTLRLGFRFGSRLANSIILYAAQFDGVPARLVLQCNVSLPLAKLFQVAH